MDDKSPASIKIVRATGFFGCARSLRIFIDGELVGRLWVCGEREFPISPGAHQVGVGIVHLGSCEDIFLGAGRRIELTCRVVNFVSAPLCMYVGMLTILLLLPIRPFMNGWYVSRPMLWATLRTIDITALVAGLLGLATLLARLIRNLRNLPTLQLVSSDASGSVDTEEAP